MRLQDAPAKYSGSYQSSVNLDLEQADQMNHKKNRDVEVGDARLILKSPNGTRYSLTVDNSGNLSAASI